MFACKARNVETAQILIQYGADVSAVDSVTFYSAVRRNSYG